LVHAGRLAARELSTAIGDRSVGLVHGGRLAPRELSAAIGDRSPGLVHGARRLVVKAQLFSGVDVSVVRVGVFFESERSRGFVELLEICRRELEQLVDLTQLG
jgi:hypothetical protein